ncbi:MAG: hypothetical protein M0030_11535 [Actinomycetota bacterium]|nr:hypothetical protein [Actinomycetota bacterium]
MTGLWHVILEHDDAISVTAELDEAWDEWRKESCAERNGGHVWLLVCEPGSDAVLVCEHCPADADDLLPGDSAALCASLTWDGQDVSILFAAHDSDRHIEIPVSAQVQTRTYDVPGCVPETDAWIDLAVCPDYLPAPDTLPAIKSASAW